MSVPVVRARSLDEALGALERATADTRLLAGGTDLMLELEIGRTRPDHVIDIWSLDELRGVAAEDGGLRIGALTDCGELERAALVRERADVLAAAAATVGAVQIKNRATIGGNLGTASPAADLVPALVALDAIVRLRCARGARDVPVAQFLVGYRATARRPDELIESVFVPARDPRERRAFKKVGTRAAQSISKVVVALALTVDGGVVRALRAGAGSVADRTVALPTLERELVGRAPDAAALDAAARASAARDCAPIDDVRSTALYRRHVLRRCLRTMLGDLAGVG